MRTRQQFFWIFKERSEDFLVAFSLMWTGSVGRAEWKDHMLRSRKRANLFFAVGHCHPRLCTSATEPRPAVLIFVGVKQQSRAL
jgi:hypothetical protein